MLDQFTQAPAATPVHNARPRALICPADALERLLEQARKGEARGFGADRVTLIAATPTAPILEEILFEADALTAAGVTPRVILGRARRSPAALERLYADIPKDAIRVAEFRGAREMLEQATIGLIGQWTGRTLAWRPTPTPDGRFNAFVDAPGGRRRAAMAHARFETAWEASTGL